MSAIDLHTLSHASAALGEADRLMTICNSCRYCEGLCAVFPAMEMRRSFPDGDLNYLANLCHSCGACYTDCQFSPPHEFSVNVPKVLAAVRAESYASYAWPRAFAPVFARNGLAISIISALSVAAFILGFALAGDPKILFSPATGPGTFYRIMPHNTMALLFGAVFVYALLALWMGVRNFWRAAGESAQAFSARDVWQAVKDAGSLRYLDGGGAGCVNKDEYADVRRKHFHHAAFYGFAFCFASTSVATLYHYAGWEAPYAFYDLPVVLGMIGGAGLVIGPAGLFIEKGRRDPALRDAARRGMDVAFIAMLLATGVSGMALLFLRDTAAMGPLLALHLGIVFALFLTMPYGKFVHGIYRFAALVRYAAERAQSEAGEEAGEPVTSTGQGGARP